MIEAHLKRLALVYAAGDLDETTYRAERARLRQRLEENGEATHASLWDAPRAAALLSDIGDLLDGANEAERRAALRYLFVALWLERHRVVALTPTTLYEPMLAVVETLRVKEGWLGCLTGYRDPLATSVTKTYLWRRDRSALVRMKAEDLLCQGGL
jgi:hypothetical protein